MSAPVKFLPCDWSLSDEEAKLAGRITVSQEVAILDALEQIGTSGGFIIGDDPGFGKTTIGAEVIVRSGFGRVLLIGLGDTHKQWDERIRLQSDGRLGCRIMNGSKAGRAEYEAFMKQEPGIFIATADFLREKDWESVIQRDDMGRPIYDVDKKTGLIKLNPRKEGEIGPSEFPIFKTKSEHKGVYRKFARKPLDAVIFDECQAIANRKSATRRTIYSIKAGLRGGLSGTWFLNALENMWSVARWVWPGENPETGQPYVETNHDVWKSRYLISEVVSSAKGRVVKVGRQDRVLTRVVGERIEGEFVGTLPCYIRREMPQVPDPAVIRLPATPQQAAQMEELQKDLVTWVLDWQGNEIPLVVDLPPILRMRLRQVTIAELSLDYDEDGSERVYFRDEAASAKLGPIRSIIEGPWAGQPVLIYTDSKIGAHFIAGRMQRASVDARTWTGDLSRPEREKLKQAFLAGEFDYLVVTVQSFGTGIDGFQRRCNKVIWVSEADGNPALNRQAIARVFRPGMTEANGGFAHAKLVIEDSVDEISMQQLINKAWAIRAAMNGGIAA